MAKNLVDVYVWLVSDKKCRYTTSQAVKIAGFF